MGIFELFESKALNFFFVHRLPENSDNRIILVTITEKDINDLEEYPLSDEVLTTLLKKIAKQKPNCHWLRYISDVSRSFVRQYSPSKSASQFRFTRIISFYP
ncbi:MAG: CHASE2 domain-containing protein [Hydrococcus sp. SU_1_0]|nr:CHASE2 domain-containing protein [Hydrococcus sp. SU_1_0]